MQIQWLNTEQCNTGKSDYMASSSITVIGRKDIQMVTVAIKGKLNKH